MDIEINKIHNELNFYKRAKILSETCTKAIFIVYKLLYNWSDKCPHKLANHLDKIPINQCKILKNLFRGPGEIVKIEAMMANEDEMKGYDITFFYKLIQFATNNDKIKPANDDVWNKNCPINKKNELEHLLFLVKNDRNEFNHKDKKFLNLKDEDTETFCNILFQRLPSIIQQAGMKAGADQTEIDEICDNLIDEIESIRVMKEISSCDEKPILKIMVEKDLMPALIELKRCFNEELKSYCPPNFKIGNRTISTKDLLSNSDRQLICINAESGFGKTSFTKFIQFELLSKIETTGDDLASHEIPIRIACRNITGRDVSKFLEDEIPISRNYTSSTSSLKFFLKRFDIYWIIDGYDERTAEFYGFFQSLLKTLPSNHKIIITTRPNSLTEIRNQLKNMKVCDVSIESFAYQQIKEVAEKYLGEDKAPDFATSIKTLNDEIFEFIQTPINLILCLELWAKDVTIFEGQLTSIYQLYDVIFEKLRNLLVDRHNNKTNVTSDDDLKMRVCDWFSDLCAILAESPFGYELNISESQKEKLLKSASHYFLLGNFCMSTFFNCERTSYGIKYIIKHKIQKEVLVSLYLKNCEYNNLKVIAKQEEISYLLMRKNPFNIFKFLMECCSKYEFSRIFALYFEMYPSLQRPGCLLQIKREKEDYFNALKNEMKDSGQVVFHVDKHDDPMDLMNIIQYLSPDVKSFKLVVNIGDGSDIKFCNNINEFLSKYEDYIQLKLSIIVSEDMVNIFNIFKSHKKLIKEIHIQFSRQTINWHTNYLSFQNLKIKFDSVILNEKMKNILNSKYLQNISIDIDDSKYLDSFVHHLTTSPLSLSVSRKSCHAHFIIKKIENPSAVIKDLLKIIKKFGSISVDFELNDQYIRSDIEKDLVTKFESSDVQLKQLGLGLGYSCQEFIWMQFVNCKTTEALNVNMSQDNDLQSLKSLKYLFEIMNFGKLLQMKEISFEIATIDQMNILLDKLPTKRFDEIVIKVRFDPDKWLSVVDDPTTRDSSMNKFKKVEILKCEYNPSSFGKINLNIIQFFKPLTKLLIIYGVPYSSQISDLTEDEQKIKDVAVKYLGDVEAEDFLYWYRNLNDDSKQSMKILIIVKFCLLLWQKYRLIFKGKLTAHNLFEKSIHSIVELHSRDGRSISIKGELKTRVEKWVDHLCKVAAKVMFTMERAFTKSDEGELMQSASDLDLTGSLCLSLFLNHVESSAGETNYLFKDDIQKEILAYFGMKMSDDNELYEISKDFHPKSIDDFTFLLEWRDGFEFVRVFSIFVKKWEKLMTTAFVMKLKDENCFDALINKIYSGRPCLELCEYNDDSIKIFLHLLPNACKIELVSEIKRHEKINDFINKYKDRISFYLKLKVSQSNEFVPAIQMFTKQGNNNLIKELDLNSKKLREWNEQMKKEFSKLENLVNLSFYIDFDYYYSSILSHFATSVHDAPSTPAVLTHLNTPETSSSKNNPVALATISSRSLAHFNQSCHAHFNIFWIKNPSKVLADVLKVNTMFQSTSIDLHFCHSTPDIDINCLKKFMSSSVKVKGMAIHLKYFTKCPNVMQLVNYVDIERLLLFSWNDNESLSLLDFKYFFDICDFDKLKKLNDIKFRIGAKSPLIMIYNKLTSDILNKTTLTITLNKFSDDMERIIVDPKYKKRFKEIIINPEYLSASELAQLESISKKSLVGNYGRLVAAEKKIKSK